MTAATLRRPAVRHQEDELPMQPQLNTSPAFGDARLPAHFWAKVDENGPTPAHRPDLGPCWDWIASRYRNGYGQFGAGSRSDGTRRMVLAHRWAYEQLVGPIPEGLESDHLCRNRACIRPSHIEPVTGLENVRRGLVPMVAGAYQRAKTHCAQGHPYDEANTYRWGGRRDCRACAAARKRHRS